MIPLFFVCLFHCRHAPETTLIRFFLQVLTIHTIAADLIGLDKKKLLIVYLNKHPLTSIETVEEDHLSVV